MRDCVNELIMIPANAVVLITSHRHLLTQYRYLATPASIGRYPIPGIKYIPDIYILWSSFIVVLETLESTVAIEADRSEVLCCWSNSGVVEMECGVGRAVQLSYSAVPRLTRTCFQ